MPENLYLKIVVRFQGKGAKQKMHFLALKSLNKKKAHFQIPIMTACD